MRNRNLLNGNETAAAIVVGGGVIGLAIARALAGRGMKRIVLVERESAIGAEASWAAAGMLAAQAEADCADAFLELACASRSLYPAFADALLDETGINIELERSGTLYLAFTDQDEAEIAHRYDWQTRAGLAVERLTADAVRRLESCISPHVRGALLFPQDVQVENRRLVAALAASAQKLGVRVLTETNIDALLIEHGRVRGVETTRGAIHAPRVIVASGAWTSLIKSSDKRITLPRIEPVRGQMLCFESRPQPLCRHVIYSPRAYIVPRLDGRLLAGATTERAGFDKSVTNEATRAILSHAVEIAPVLERMLMVDAWAGLRPCAEEDGWPVLGTSAEASGLFYATGHYRNGILLAPITGELIADAVVANGAASPLLLAFSPDRFQSVGIA